MAQIKLIVGLGNPGREYEKTRHNIGFMAVQALAAQLGCEFTKCRYASALVAEDRREAVKTFLILPQTYMNNSGIAVRELVKFDNVDLADMLVVCDDIRLSFGAMRLKLEGSDGGHNGLKSMIAHLGTDRFARLRLGVGEPPSASMQADYVLAEFKRDEKLLLRDFIEEAVGCLKLWLCGETAKAMTQFNKRKGNG